MKNIEDLTLADMEGLNCSEIYEVAKRISESNKEYDALFTGKSTKGETLTIKGPKRFEK